MRFLVVGGAGFIGSHLVEYLVSNDHHVRVLDDFSTGRQINLTPFAGEIEVIEASITEPEACSEAVQGVDYVFHQAALPSVPRSVRDPAATHHACATGTLNVLLAARDAGVKRVIYAGSSSAYGDAPVLPKTEDMLPHPLSPYAAAKLTGEVYCHVFFHTYGLETVVLRYFNVFGPRQDPTSQYSAVIPKFLAHALADEKPVIYGDGQQTRDFTYVANIVRANMLACDAGEEVLGQAINVGCGERTSVNELWARIRQITHKDIDPQYRPARPGDVRDSSASLDKANRLLGYTPEVSLREGLQRTMEFFAATPAG